MFAYSIPFDKSATASFMGESYKATAVVLHDGNWLTEQGGRANTLGCDVE
jgi:hypothetical protein